MSAFARPAGPRTRRLVALRCRQLTQRRWFTAVTFTTIVDNAVLLGVETYAGVLGRRHDELKFVEHVFLGAARETDKKVGKVPGEPPPLRGAAPVDGEARRGELKQRIDTARIAVDDVEHALAPPGPPVPRTRGPVARVRD